MRISKTISLMEATRSQSHYINTNWYMTLLGSKAINYCAFSGHKDSLQSNPNFISNNYSPQTYASATPTPFCCPLRVSFSFTSAQYTLNDHFLSFSSNASQSFTPFHRHPLCASTPTCIGSYYSSLTASSHGTKIP